MVDAILNPLLKGGHLSYRVPRSTYCLAKDLGPGDGLSGPGYMHAVTA